MLPRLRFRLRGLFRRRSQESELNRELQFHFDMLVEENLRAGLSPAEARLAAQREFGADAVYREECRDTWRPAFLSGVLSDFIFAFRGLRRSPGFTAIAVLTLAFGIGVNATIFSFIRNALLRPADRIQQHNLVALYNGRADVGGNYRNFSHLEFEALRESTEVFAEIAAQSFGVAAVGPRGNLSSRFISVVSANYFSLLGVQPFRGRFFSAEESQPGAAFSVVVANHDFWERLGRPADFVGSSLQVNDRTFTVIGVTPPGFVGLHASLGPAVWLSIGDQNSLSGGDVRSPQAFAFSLLARLPEHVSVESARQRLDAANRQLNGTASANPAEPRHIVLTPPPRSELGNNNPQDESFLTLFAAIALTLAFIVLLVACLNLANMLLARGAARQKEIAIRLALGASRWRVIRSLLVEGLLLALLGGTAALFLSLWCDRLILQWAHDAFEFGLFSLGWPSFIDSRLLLTTLALSVGSTLLFCLVPALRVTRLDLTNDLKQLSGLASAPSRWRRIFSAGNTSIVAQIALSLALLVSAALFIKSSRQALSRDQGFQTAGQLVADIGYNHLKLDPPQVAQRQRTLVEAVASLPGVTSAALASNIPYSFSLDRRPVRRVDGTAPDFAAPQHWSGYTAVSRGYFSTLGITLLRGRDFTADESAGTGDTRPVAIIDESLAYRLFGDTDPLGRRITVERNPKPSDALEIVGVVRSHRDDVFEKHPPLRVFRPLGQAPDATTCIHFRTTHPLALIDSVRRAILAADPAAPILALRPLADYVTNHINMLLIRLAGIVFGLFGAIALVLAIVGVYGVKAYAVARRTREIGVRIALGARPRDVLNLILKQGALQLALGVTLGLALAVAAGHVLAGMLYGVDPIDPFAFLGSTALLSAAILLACWLPARRATKVDPMTALRTE